MTARHRTGPAPDPAPLRSSDSISNSRKEPPS